MGSMQGDYNQPKTEKCFVLTAFRPDMNTSTPESKPQEVSFTLRTFVPHRGSEKSKNNQDICMSVIHQVTTPEEEHSAVVNTEDVSTLGATREINQETRKVQEPPAENYLRPVNNDNVQGEIKNTDSSRLCHEASKTLSCNRPQPKPRVKILGKRENVKLSQCKHSTNTGTLLSLQSTNMLGSNPLYDREAAQHCASVKPVDQSNHLIPQTTTRHRQHHGYQNELCTTTSYQNASQTAGRVEPPYTRVLSNTNWEVSRDHLSLFERIGGGSFGQVWKGAAFGVAGNQEWSVVAVKMLKEDSLYADLRDLLSELDLLKKLKPHPNVIQLLGCLTKDVIRCKGGREFRPPLVILEFVPHGDLLGYLKKSKGETDDYYNVESTEVPRKIPVQQLYKFASDIARGMEFISSLQLIHRDLAARNVLVGEGLRCKITDFGMARDLGKAEVYVRRSNGLMPVKWMAVESLKSQVFTTKSDVWSYGIVLYEIFTLGRNPYEGMTGEEVFNYVASGQRLPSTSAMSTELYNLMLQCWQRDPSKRPAFGSIVDWMETLSHDH
ncbi:proto-oncogene tyrosine-protein kinase receptor Ret-like isoform X1 [Oculina patagonica]